MAARAQKVAGEAIEWAKKNKTTYAAALPIFDTSFAPYYIGQIWTGDKDNRDYFERTGGGVPTTARNPKDYGQQDFKEEFLDADATRYTPATDKWGNIYDKAGNPIDGIDFRADQVHHFVAHFSAGINGAYWSSTGQKVSDRLSFNRGDRALTDAAYKMGQALKNNPRDLLTIGNTIRKEICR